ncbi:uncharacterized protein LOC132752366 [Ruditapes philippinarum]|uniref:uncharacterized protein LOC132752366 n=1 Tax=Ruditapes philippinarum TaxID=129788 RepID=UPI00295A9D69|nr:uncharacterized protein LOC132752366 [Ruditapes philippinarum]
MGTQFSRVEHAFYPECETQLSQLDNILLVVASSVDALHLSFSQLLHHLDDPSTNDTDRNELLKERQKKSIEMTTKILSSLETGLRYQTTSLLQEISQFAGMIRKKSDKSKPLSNTIPSLEKLKIDAYLAGQKPEFSEPAVKENRQLNDPTQAGKSKKEAEHIIAKLKQEKNKISGDLQKMNDENEANKKIIEECKNNMTKLREENNQLLKDKEDLKNKITKLEQDSVQIAPVQLFCQKRNDQVGFVIQEIVAQLNAKGKFGAKKLAFITCENSTDILPTLPLLVLCINASRIGTDAAKSIEGITKPQNSALIVLHYKDEHALPEQSSDRVLGEPEFKSLAGIFDIGFQSGKGIYNCDRNTNAVTGLVQFIQQILEENPLKVHVQ